MVPFVQVVGRKKTEGKVALSHWTHGEGRHQPVGEPKGAIGRREDANSFSDFLCGCHQPTAITRKTVCLQHLTHDIVYICSMADQSMASTFNLSKCVYLSPLSLSRLYQLQTSLLYYKHIKHISTTVYVVYI